MNNRFYQGFCLNTGNNASHFRSFEIITEREITDYEGGVIVESIKSAEEYYDDEEMIGEPFYAVYGSFKIGFVQSSSKILVTDNLEEAISIVEHLTGNKAQEYYYHE
ncbi:hypothetical protein EB118_10315 [bacterium]|nr:hypothetical protein [bacterium]NDC96251.1 hypothetical protein [bacterium]NDD85836.1 hypothetical protein [bacterium]NDG30450.1 hypothetical protein [bacterium]